MERTGMLDLLSRLDGVRENSSSHGQARCPAHDDKQASMSWRDTGDRWLLYCFAGCTAMDICDSLDVRLNELFHDNKQQPKWRQERQRANPRDILELVTQEATVLYLLALDLQRDGGLNESSMSRLELAASRMQAAKAAC